jgi:methyl-CpG-binding domain protein 4
MARYRSSSTTVMTLTASSESPKRQVQPPSFSTPPISVFNTADSFFWHLMVSTRSQSNRKGKRPLHKAVVRSQVSGAGFTVEDQEEKPSRIKLERKPNRPEHLPQPEGLPFKLQPAYYGLIQERIHDSLYALVVQVILWNQTHGTAARPVLFHILGLYPTPFHLSEASLLDLTEIIQPLGLQNIRARRLIALGEAWIAAPPCKERRYRKLHYPTRGCGINVKPGEILELDDHREGWEIAHLPGMGPYALDSYRMFYRDRLRGVTSGEPEWKRVLPKDKDLKPYLKWRWAKEGWDWDELTGKRVKIENHLDLPANPTSPTPSESLSHPPDPDT